VSTETTAPTPKPRLSSLFGNFELVIAILLGLVSIVTAYASFQAALYDSTMAGEYQKGSTLSTQAESVYLESNQTYIQDVQLFDRLTELKIQIESDDPAVAATAQETYDTITFQSVSEDLQAAIDYADEQNLADPDTFYTPFTSEDYTATLFGDYEDLNTQAADHVTAGDEANTLSDKLTLNTVLMSISLFLLGIAALVRQMRISVILTGVGLVIFVVAAVLTAQVPMLSV
jgi:hypothetical protein